MSSATLTHPKHHNNQASDQATQANDQASLVELRAAVFAALGKVAGDEASRDDLTDGAMHQFRFTVSGEVDGQMFSQAFTGELNVGHASERASSVGPNQDHLLAYVLAKLNHQTRDKVLRETASEFGDAGELPAVSDDQLKAAKQFRGELRQKVKQVVRGSVKVQYESVPAVSMAAVESAAGAANGSSNRKPNRKSA